MRWCVTEAVLALTLLIYASSVVQGSAACPPIKGMSGEQGGAKSSGLVVRADSTISLDRTTEQDSIVVDEGYCDLEDPTFGDAADR